MPLDVLGRTRATLTEPASTGASLPWPKGPGNLGKLRRAGDSPLQFSDLNEEFLVSAVHQIALITSLPLVFVQGAESGSERSALVAGTKAATLSNCGDLLKLSLPSGAWKRTVAGVTT